MSKDNLGDRIKKYEDCYRTYLPGKLPIILRLDGKAWHTLTKKCEKPFDLKLISALDETAMYVCNNMQSVHLAYCQSDEIQFLIYNPKFETSPWYDNNLQKMVSISAGLASSYFTSISHKVFGETKIAQFDSRVFIVPLHEVVNTFCWRQQDSTRNSIQMLARSMFSHKQCNNKNCVELKDMCLQAGINWEDLPTSQKRGRCVIKKIMVKESINKKTGEKIRTSGFDWVIDNEIPIFHEDRNYIDKYLKAVESEI